MDYEIIKCVHAGEAIKCLICNMVSYHPMDVKYKWCGNCNKCLESHEVHLFPGSSLKGVLIDCLWFRTDNVKSLCMNCS